MITHFHLYLLIPLDNIDTPWAESQELPLSHDAGCGPVSHCIISYNFILGIVMNNSFKW